jgi:hypothetical protein
MLNFLLWKEEEAKVELSNAEYTAKILAEMGHTNPEVWERMLNPEKFRLDDQHDIRFIDQNSPEDFENFLKMLEEENAWG